MRNIHVLIIEDDVMVAEINKKYTEAVEGYQVVGLVYNGSEAVEQINKIRPDVVILDNYLPETNGVDILHVSRVTARRYLEYMLDQGQVVRTMDYLTVGRPVHRFKLKRI